MSGDDFAALPLFNGLDAEAIARLKSVSTTIRLDGGEVLCRQGEPADAMFIITHGSLEVLVRTADGERVLSILGRGASVGEMALLSGEPRSATVRAIRDSELLRVPNTLFQALLDAQPGLAASFARMLAVRLRQTSLTPRVVRTVHTIGIIPAGAEPVPTEFAPMLVAALGARVCLLGGEDGEIAMGDDPDHLGHWLNAQEDAHEFVIYLCDVGLTTWTLRALRQVDLVLVVGRGEGDPAPGVIERAIADGTALTSARQELVLLHAAGASPLGTRRWLGVRRVTAHHHLRVGTARDYRRLARAVGGRSLGVVLSGGGARGFAHIGALQAMAELGVEVDMVGGTSMGAIIAAQVALGWDIPGMVARSRTGFGGIAPLGDFTFPFIALLRGRVVVKLMKGLFGDVQIEDLWLPFFCVSTNLSRAQVVTHDSGPLWLWLRASCSVPGIGPPVPHEGDLLVDGGVLNNMPVDIMRQRCPGRVIAVDVSAAVDLTTRVATCAEMSGWPHLARRLNPWSRRVAFPNVFAILTRTAAMSSAATMERMAQAADLYLRPPTEGINPFDWSALERGVSIGYNYTKEMINTHKTKY